LKPKKRTELLDLRRSLMQRWPDYVTEKP